MRSALAQIAVLFTVSLFTSKHTILAQQTLANPLGETQSDQYCPSLRAYNQQAPGPEISIAGVSFSGALQMAVVDQD
jgi:hypothetical protein